MTMNLGYALGPDQSLEALGMGIGSVLSLKVTGEESGGRVSVIQGVVAHGGPPLHVHRSEDELVICLDGELSYQVGEQRGVLEPGGVVWMPRGVAHAVANLAEQPCRFLTVVTPSGIEDFFRAQSDYLEKLGDAPFDPEAFAGVAGGEQRPIVGPPLT
jgi:quercetin dioxygenase-like cupin family protein